MDEKWMESLGSPWHVGKSLCKVRLLLLRVFLSHFLFVAVNSCVAPFSLSLSAILTLSLSSPSSGSLLYFAGRCCGFFLVQFVFTFYFFKRRFLVSVFRHFAVFVCFSVFLFFFPSLVGFVAFLKFCMCGICCLFGVAFFLLLRRVCFCVFVKVCFFFLFSVCICVPHTFWVCFCLWLELSSSLITPSWILNSQLLVHFFSWILVATSKPELLPFSLNIWKGELS